MSEAGFESLGANVSLSAASLLVFECHTVMCGGVSRFAGLRRRNQRHGWAFCVVVDWIRNF
jgi:hypothetical protein